MADVTEQILTDDPLSLATIATIRARRATWRSTTRSPDVKAIRYRDHTFVNDGRKEPRPYGWLPAGWVVQERVMGRSNRVYRNYYDPSGFHYQKKHIAEAAIEEMKTRLVAENPPLATSSSDSSATPSPPNSLSQLVRVASDSEDASTSTSSNPCCCFCSPPM